jgi:hypothetical protein
LPKFGTKCRYGAAGTEKLGQSMRDRTDRTGQWELDSKAGKRGKRAGNKKAGPGQLRLDNWDREAGTGQPERAVEAIQPGQERDDRTART